MTIPKEISDDEILARGIFHPLMVSKSKGKLKKEAFYPLIGTKEVSVLRYYFSNPNRLKTDFKKINIRNNKYFGIALINANEINNLSENKKTNLSDVIIAASPLNENHNPIEDEIIVSEMPGLPMHADIVYNQVIEKGKPAPSILKCLAKQLSMISRLFIDPEPEALGWTGDTLAVD